jgi:peptide/nickel transport system substrate-binding protein
VFSNGEPFTSAAVVAELAWLQTDAGQLTAAGRALKEATAEAEDDHAVIIHTAKPDPLLPRRLSDVMIVAPHAWEDLGPEAYPKTPATTGPFRVADWTPGKVTLVANPNSWRKAHAERVVLAVLPDRAARLRALLSGQFDAARLSAEDIDALEAKNFLTSVTPAAAVLAIGFRQDPERDTPLRDARVRQALNYGVDKNALSATILRGVAGAAGQPAARDVQGYTPDIKAYPYDPARAKTLLADAGFSDGLALTFAVTPDLYAGDLALYRAAADALAGVGVKVTLRTLTNEDWNTARDSATWNENVDGFALPFDSTPTDDVTAALTAYSCLKLVPFVCDHALTDRIIAANDAMGVDRRATMLSDIAQSYHDDPPALYLADGVDVFGVGRRIEGFTVAGRVPVYENIAPAAKAKH